MKIFYLVQTYSTVVSLGLSCSFIVCLLLFVCLIYALLLKIERLTPREIFLKIYIHPTLHSVQNTVSTNSFRILLKSDLLKSKDLFVLIHPYFALFDTRQI